MAESGFERDLCRIGDLVRVQGHPFQGTGGFLIQVDEIFIWKRFNSGQTFAADSECSRCYSRELPNNLHSSYPTNA
jgi:predicted Rdx family selenoprotein